MLISLKSLIYKHRLNITGIIHAGAHQGQEIRDYRRNGIRNIYLFEPCEDAFKILKRDYASVPAFQFALGASEGIMQMNIERKNSGQSNSLLKPVLHLDQFPDIIFDDVQEVRMRTLDSFRIPGCNFLNMDVQGYELEVLKGATETLKGIDYIYTEVNRDEVYERCARIEELDEYLKHFKRVETDWSGGTWGDAFYIRHTKEVVKPTIDEDYFQPHMKQNYPPDNDLIFEEWYSKQEKPESERVYLPVNWTSFYVNHKYGKDRAEIQKLQRHIDSFDKSKKYYTVIQYDDGILNNVSQFDLKVFSMSGHGIPIPLVAKKHEYEFKGEKKYLANFIGKKTHRVRNGIFKIKDDRFYISEQPHDLKTYCKIMSESVFALCPRGYGKTSFRIQEAVQYGAIPVYISDEFIMPPNFEDYGILIRNENEILKTLSEISQGVIEEKQEQLKYAYEDYFTYTAVKKFIEDNIN